jgi:opacity protein-like surface antigen
MKGLWLTTVLLSAMILATSSQAQVTFAVGPRIGFDLGTCSIDPDLNPAVTKGGRFGIIFGATLEVGFTKMFYAVFEPQYVQKGFKIEGTGGKQSYAFNYLDLPLFFKVKFLQGKVRPYAFLGPDFGLALSATQSTELTGQSATDQDWKDVIGTDFSLDFGGGVEVAVASKISVIGDVRYMLGIKSVYSNANEPNTTIKTRGFVVLFGALFYL